MRPGSLHEPHSKALQGLDEDVIPASFLSDQTGSDPDGAWTDQEQKPGPWSATIRCPGLARGEAGMIFRGQESSFEALVEDRADQEAKEEEDYLLCAVCRRAITRLEARIVMNGKHTHVFFNPQGIVFEIGCFATAFGCAHVGQATTEFTWFPGYAWRIAICAGCSAHLGWHYQGEGGQFYGLILANLVEGTPET